MSENRDLIEFLSREENVKIAYRVGSAMDELRESLLGKFFTAVKKGIESEFGNNPMNWKAYVEKTSISYPFLTRNLISKEDPLGVSVQFYGDHLYLGISWSPERPKNDIEPPQTTSLCAKAEQALGESAKSDSWWLANVKCRMTIEEACCDVTASGSPIAIKIGGELGKLMQIIEPDLRKAILALSRAG